MKSPKISVIIPVYNTEEYVGKCIQSILEQNFIDFELLLIDDGSADRSGEICDEYAKRDKRIIVFHQENGGVTSARRCGVLHASGEFITFVDSDDRLTPDALATLIAKMKDGIDVVISSMLVEEVITGEELLKRFLENRIPVVLWGKLYRKFLFESDEVMDIKREICVGEDFLMNIKLATRVKTAYLLPKKVYSYRTNLQSVSHTWHDTLEYEKMLVSEVEKAIENVKIENINCAFYKFQLQRLDMLIQSGANFSYNSDWIRQLRKDRWKYPLCRREKIVIHLTNLTMSRWILEKEKKIMKPLSCIKRKLLGNKR